MITIILGHYPLVLTVTHLTPFDYGLYDSLSRIVWSIALCYIIFSCMHCCNGSTNRFLSHWLLQVASRLCYGIFCVHFSIILLMMGTIKSSQIHINVIKFCYKSFVVLVSSIFLAILATLAIEMPFIKLEELIFEQKSSDSNSFTKKIDLNCNENCCKPKID